ncbi:hypothetical protein [Paludisphaera soli]|uniref:hypothetical protein n=1 Tax=Paludisphaera soli TaxID=2712865 RepID=UPI0013E9C221|nr:hypothetical protein [Paludisphaera soli]
MRQLTDLAVWAGLILLTMGVVYYTPKVAEYMASEPKPPIVTSPRSGAPGARHLMHHQARHFGEARPVH